MSSTKKVYLCGGMEYAGSEGGIWRNTAQGKLKGYEIFHPYQGEAHILNKYGYKDNTEFAASKLTDTDRYIACMKPIIMNDIAQLATSQVILAKLDRSCIGGAAGELTLAVDLMIPVIGWVDWKDLDRIPGWCLACCKKLVSTLDEAVEEVKLILK